ncbi:MAG: murein biosynthesis integral membrane protein MurJ, partial [Alphaproteobacteria bacterium RIFOXYD12_FULL_60_8]
GIDLSLVRPRLTPEVKTLLRRIVPGAVGAGVYQINLLVDTILASLVADGAVSYLYYADRVNQLPLGVVGVAVGTALLPLLSRQLKAGDDGAALHSQNRALEFALFLTLPSAFALMVLSDPIIAVLFERGAFGAEQAAATAKALAAFALGLPAYVLIKVFTPGFFARGDTKTPVQVAIIALLANIAFNLVLMGPLGHMGIALSTSLSAWLNAMTLAWLLKRQGRFSLDPRLKTRLPRILLACGLMTTALYGGLVLGSDWLSAGPLLARGGVLSGLIGLGLGTYLLSAQLFGAVALGEVKKLVRRRS